MKRREFNKYLCTLPILTNFSVQTKRSLGISLDDTKLCPYFIDLNMNILFTNKYSSFLCTSYYDTPLFKRRLYNTKLKINIFENNYIYSNIYENITDKLVDYSFDFNIAMKNITIKNSIPEFIWENEIFKLIEITR